MEPLLIPDGSHHRAALNDLASISPRSRRGSAAAFPSHPDPARQPRARDELLLLEPHRGTRYPPESTSAGAWDDSGQDRKRRDLRIEAKAHMAVEQRVFGRGRLVGEPGGQSRRHGRTSSAVLRAPAGRPPLGQQLADGERARVVAGELRGRDVKVGARSVRSLASLPCPVRRGIRRTRQGRPPRFGRRRSPPAALDSPVCRRRRDAWLAS